MKALVVCVLNHTWLSYGAFQCRACWTYEHQTTLGSK